jgi:23S rRNA pseudouridine1911/1915/1917 synthase
MPITPACHVWQAGFPYFARGKRKDCSALAKTRKVGEMGTHKSSQTVTLDPDQSERLDKALTHHVTSLSREQLKRLILAGHVRAEEGTPLTDPALKIKGSLTVCVHIPPPEPSHLQPEPGDLDILFEDTHLLVLNKPAGLTVHPGAGQRGGTLVNALLAHCAGQLSGIGGVERPGIVHRLDKDTSGLLVVAKTDAAHRPLANAFKNRAIRRSYLALCAGVPLPPAGKIDLPLGRHPTHRTKMAVVAANKGRRAVTHYQVQEKFGAISSLLQCRLETGRTHQIRVHLAHKHHPILGDPLYSRHTRLKGASEALTKALQGLTRQMLHAEELGFTHPVTQEELLFQAPPPADFSDFYTLLKKT